MTTTKVTVIWAFGSQIMSKTDQYGSPTETDPFQVIQERFLPLTIWES